MNKIKQWFLQLWLSIMERYAKSQIEKLKEDFQEVYYEYNCYKELYNSLLLLWLADSMNTPELTLLSETRTHLIIQMKLNNTEVQLPVTKNKGIFKNILYMKKAKDKFELKNFDENASEFKKYALLKVMESYE